MVRTFELEEVGRRMSGGRGRNCLLSSVGRVGKTVGRSMDAPDRIEAAPPRILETDGLRTHFLTTPRAPAAQVLS